MIVWSKVLAPSGEGGKNSNTAALGIFTFLPVSIFYGASKKSCKFIPNAVLKRPENMRKVWFKGTFFLKINSLFENLLMEFCQLKFKKKLIIRQDILAKLGNSPRSDRVL